MREPLLKSTTRGQAGALVIVQAMTKSSLYVLSITEARLGYTGLGLKVSLSTTAMMKTIYSQK